MAEKHDPTTPGEPALDLPPIPDDSDTRFYSDFIVYFCKNGAFQINAIADSANGRPGLLSIMKTERIVRLGLKRRKTPIWCVMNPGAEEEKIYLFATVRAGKSFNFAES